MDEQLKDELTRRFRRYLDHDFVPQAEEDVVDRMRLFEELAGIKNEVRLESRQLKGALDDFRQAFTSLDQGRQEMLGLLSDSKQKANTELEPLISGLIDLWDRVEAGLKQEPPPASFLERLPTGFRRTRRWLRRHLQGQEMIANRLLELFGQFEVRPLDVMGTSFDPFTMTAVGFRSERHLEEGLVLGEERKGFQRHGRLIRPAEVIVNKQGTIR